MQILIIYVNKTSFGGHVNVPSSIFAILEVASNFTPTFWEQSTVDIYFQYEIEP